MPGYELIGEAEREAVLAVLETGVLMRYGFDAARNGLWPARELEARLATRLGVPHVHVCSSGTAALTTALAACGVGAGDEVILPPFTFVADVEAVLWLGAVPVFAEIDETLCLDPASVEARITPKTRAVLVVHMCGAMARIDELMAVCRGRGIQLIEDAAQAMGASDKGRALGTIGRAGCYSYDYVKTMTCGEGGAIATSDAALYQLVQAFTDHGHDHRGRDRGADDHPMLGLNFRISELNAAVGLAQLGRLDEVLRLQRRNVAILRDAIAGVPGLTFREVPDPDGDSCTFLSFLLPTEQAARAAAGRISGAGIDGCMYWYDNKWHYLRMWQHVQELASPSPLAVSRAGWLDHLRGVQVPRSDAIIGRTISLAIKVGWTEVEVADRGRRLRAALG